MKIFKMVFLSTTVLLGDTFASDILGLVRHSDHTESSRKAVEVHDQNVKKIQCVVFSFLKLLSSAETSSCGLSEDSKLDAQLEALYESIKKTLLENKNLQVNLQKATAAEKKAKEHTTELTSRSSTLMSELATLGKSLEDKESELRKEKEESELLRTKISAYGIKVKDLERYKVENERLKTELTVSRGRLQQVHEAFKFCDNQPDLFLKTVRSLNLDSNSSADNDNSDSTSPAGPINDYSSAATPSGFSLESTESLKRELEAVKKEKDAEIAELRAQLDRFKESIRGNTTAEVNQKPDTEKTIDPDVLQMYFRAQGAATDKHRVTWPLAEPTGFFPDDTDSDQGSVHSSRSSLRSESYSSYSDSPSPNPNRGANEEV
jgi:hypothetical protein